MWFFDDWLFILTNMFFDKNLKTKRFQTWTIWQLLLYIEFPFKWYTLSGIISYLNIFGFFLSNHLLGNKKSRKILEKDIFTYCIPFERKSNVEWKLPNRSCLEPFSFWVFVKNILVNIIKNHKKITFFEKNRKVTKGFS